MLGKFSAAVSSRRAERWCRRPVRLCRNSCALILLSKEGSEPLQLNFLAAGVAQKGSESSAAVSARAPLLFAQEEHRSGATWKRLPALERKWERISEPSSACVWVVRLLKRAWHLGSGFLVASEKLSHEAGATWEIIKALCIFITRKSRGETPALVIPSRELDRG